MKKYIYLILVISTSLVMSIYGFVAMGMTGEKYGDQPALVATAVNSIENTFSPPEDDGLIDIAALGGDSAAGHDMSGTPQDGDYDDPEEGEGEEEDGKEDDSADAEQGSSDKEKAGNDEDVKESEDSSGDEKSSDDKEESSSKKKKKKKKKSSSSSSKKKKKKKKWITVDESYFDDALFIGDSRQQGFGMYSGLDNSTVYAVKSYTVFAISSKLLVDTPFGKITLVDALALNQHRFKKVYIMFGINEMASKNEEFIQRYYNLVDYVKLTQPGAAIYVESVMHVTASTAAKRPTLSNENIEKRNELLKKLAKDEGAYYLDLNEVLTDESGSLFSDAASDGIHLKASYIEIMKEYLMSHAVEVKLKKVDKDESDPDSENTDEYGFPYMELNPAQQMLKDQLDAYYAQQLRQAMQ